jgi:hypothetical protein
MTMTYNTTKTKPILMASVIAAILIVAFAVAAPQTIFATSNSTETLTSPTIKKLESTQATLFNKYQQLGKNELPITGIFVDPRIPALVVGIDYKAPLPLTTYKEKIRGIINEDIQLVVDYGELIELACTNQNSQCSPQTGAIAIEAAYNSTHTATGTLTLADTDNLGRKGIVISGHIANPANSGTDIGQNTLSRVVADEVVNPSGTRNCDCAFAEIRKDASGAYLYSTDENAIWKASNTYWTITSKKGSDQTPGGTAVRFMGIVSGEKSGTVVTVNAQVLGGSYGTLNGQTLATFTGQSGDNGAPIFSPGTTNVTLYGILVGNYKIGSTTYGVYSPWQHIKSELNLTP